MAKDSQGNYLHIEDEVTFNQSARPKRLIGRHGRVASLGEKTVVVDPIVISGRSITKQERIDPLMLTRGLHRIVDPVLFDPKIKGLFMDGMRLYLGILTEEAVRREIMSDLQARQFINLVLQLCEEDRLKELKEGTSGDTID